MNPPAQVANRTLANPISIYVEHKFSTALNKDGAKINATKGNDKPILSMFDDVIYDTAL
jgi:hypothetical protein